VYPGIAEAVAAMTRTRRVEPDAGRMAACDERYRKWREVYGMLQTWTL
jgi:sugar (pentulose or hexulose) kinase